MKSNSLTLKIIGLSAAQAFVLIAVIVAALVTNVARLTAENRHLAGYQNAIAIATHIENVLRSTGSLQTLDLKPSYEEFVKIDAAGFVLYSTTGRPIIGVSEGKPFRPGDGGEHQSVMVARALNARDFEQSAAVQQLTGNGKVLESWIPVSVGDSQYVAMIQLPASEAVSALSGVWWTIASSTVLILLILAAGAILGHLFFIAPLRTFAASATAIIQENRNIRIPIVRQDEIGYIAAAFNEMSIALRNLQKDSAGDDPLTGLPGRIATSRYIEECLASDRLICVMFADLNNLRSYNMKYGFARGDEALLFARDCVVAAARRSETNEAFVGHEGNDNFVAVIDHEVAADYAKSLITMFDRGILQFYSSGDARQGYIEFPDRKGDIKRFPIISLSIAGVSNKSRPFRRYAEFVQVAFELQGHIKKQSGSTFAIDRRQGPIVEEVLVESIQEEGE